MVAPFPLLAFRCTSCGNCCKEPLLPVTTADLARIIAHTGERARDIVTFVGRDGIELDDEEDFVRLPAGDCVMVLRHKRLPKPESDEREPARGRSGAPLSKGCRYLGADDRCSIYDHRPTGCRVFPFDANFNRKGELVHLALIQATDCRYELDGHNEPRSIASVKRRFDEETAAYHAQVKSFNSKQKRLARAGARLQTQLAFLKFLGLE